MTDGKKQSITLVRGEINQFQVKAITNSLVHEPGDWISKEAAVAFCNDAKWEVTVIDNQLFQEILGGVVGGAIGRVI